MSSMCRQKHVVSIPREPRRCQNPATEVGLTCSRSSRIKDCRMFQIVRVELNRDGQVVARRPLQPLYDLWDDAMALAEFDASRCAGDYGPLPDSPLLVG